MRSVTNVIYAHRPSLWWSCSRKSPSNVKASSGAWGESYHLARRYSHTLNSIDPLHDQPVSRRASIHRSHRSYSDCHSECQMSISPMRRTLNGWNVVRHISWTIFYTLDQSSSVINLLWSAQSSKFTSEFKYSWKSLWHCLVNWELSKSLKKSSALGKKCRKFDNLSL